MENMTYQGLSEGEAASNLLKYGPNELTAKKKRSTLFSLALDVIREPMILLLLVAGIVYFFLGDHKEAVVLLIFVFVIIIILIFQQRKTERVLETLRDLTSPRALVIRDGKYRRISGREVVVDDILVLEEGDRIAADAVLLDAYDLRVNESLLTGEPIPVSKKKSNSNGNKPHPPGGDDSPYLYAGMMVTQGQGIARVIATSANTELGKIGKTIQDIKPQKTPLQISTNRLVRNLVIVGLSLSIFIVLIYGYTRGSWLGGILAGITFAMAMLPEEFPVILTVFFALGAWRISKQHVLTRQIPAIEALGATTVLCVDKTGTLTLNEMQVTELVVADDDIILNYDNEESLPQKYVELVEYAVLASEIKPFDPMEKAIHRLSEQYLKTSSILHSKRQLAHEYELTSEFLVMTHIWQLTPQNTYAVAVKGAPEIIYRLCQLNDSKRKELTQTACRMAEKGLRVLGVAKAITNDKNWPPTPMGFNYTFLGLIGLSDPIRSSAKRAIETCHEAGIRVVMITGDYPTTALAVARQLGIQDDDHIITGQNLTEQSNEILKSALNNTNVFARILPAQKLKIIEIFKSNGEIVAMTGDGVNDAPALKTAHIGIAMGQRGTDVAREASSIVLLNDDLSSILTAIKLGRRIFDNIKKAMSYIFAIHIPIAGLTLIPLILGWPLLFYPIHIAFLQLIIDPVCSVAFEAEPAEKNIMNRPPRKLYKSIFSRRLVILSIIQGLSILAFTLGIYWLGLSFYKSENIARALAFTTLVFANLSLILMDRSWSQSLLANIKMPNKAMWGIIAGALIVICSALYLPFLQHLFHFEFLGFKSLLVCIIAGICSVAWFEVIKFFSYKP
jgi:Ca2+-transporting ATPase